MVTARMMSCVKIFSITKIAPTTSDRGEFYFFSLDSRHQDKLPSGGDAERRFNVPPTIDLGKVIYFGSESFIQSKENILS